MPGVSDLMNVVMNLTKDDLEVARSSFSMNIAVMMLWFGMVSCNQESVDGERRSDVSVLIVVWDVIEGYDVEREDWREGMMGP